MKITLCILFISFLLIGCEDVFKQRILIDVQPPPEKLILLTDFENINSPRVLLSLTGVDYDDVYTYRGNYKPAPSSKIEVWENGISLGIMAYDTLSTHTFKDKKIVPREGQNYEIRVNTDGFSQIWAADKMPATVALKAELTGITKKIRTWSNQNDAHEVKLSFNDPSTENNFYRFSFVQKIVQNQDSAFYFGNISFYSNDLIFKSNSVFENDPNISDLKYISRRNIFNDKSFNGLQKDVLIYVYLDGSDSAKDKVASLEIRLENISKDTYQYELTRQQALDNDGNPFVQPTIIHNNIKGGGLGALNMYNVSSAPISIKHTLAN